MGIKAYTKRPPRSECSPGRTNLPQRGATAMNNKIIQSIHHGHGENILNGVKGYEIKKTAPKSGYFPYSIYLYETEHPYRGADNALHPGAGAIIGFYVCKAIIKTSAFGAALCKSNTPEEAAARNRIAYTACLIEKQLTEYASGKVCGKTILSDPNHFFYTFLHLVSHQL